MTSPEQQPTPGNPDEPHPAQEAHGGSMAPGLVDDTGHLEPDAVPGTAAPEPAISTDDSQKGGDQ